MSRAGLAHQHSGGHTGTRQRPCAAQCLPDSNSARALEEEAFGAASCRTDSKHAVASSDGTPGAARPRQPAVDDRLDEGRNRPPVRAACSSILSRAVGFQCAVGGSRRGVPGRHPYPFECNERRSERARAAGAGAHVADDFGLSTIFVPAALSGRGGPRPARIKNTRSRSRIEPE